MPARAPGDGDTAHTPSKAIFFIIRVSAKGGRPFFRPMPLPHLGNRGTLPPTSRATRSVITAVAPAKVDEGERRPRRLFVGRGGEG